MYALKLLGFGIACCSMGTAAIKVINFDCNDTPELCNNMCWGAYCTDQGDGPFTTTMLYDADQGAKQDRYNRACATPRNRCNGNGMYNSCDEYPFESTSDADLVDAVSRCVTVNAQSKQGAKLKTAYATMNDGDQFRVTFANVGSTKYCNIGRSGCDNSDGKQWQNGGPAPNPTAIARRKRHFYLTERGTEIMSFDELDAGSHLHDFHYNTTRAEENDRKLGKRDFESEYGLIDDYVAFKTREE